MVELYLPDATTGEPVVTASFTYVFDVAGQLLSETDPLGRVTQHEYDALGRQTALVLNDPDGAGPLASPEYHYSYDAASRLILEVAPNGGETEYEYDLLDNVVLLRRVALAKRRRTCVPRACPCRLWRGIFRLERFC